MTKISFVLVISLFMVMPFRPVLSQDWMSMFSQVKHAGLSEETIQDATKTLGQSGTTFSEEAVNDAKKAIAEAEKALGQPPALSALVESMGKM